MRDFSNVIPDAKDKVRAESMVKKMSGGAYAVEQYTRLMANKITDSNKILRRTVAMVEFCYTYSDDAKVSVFVDRIMKSFGARLKDYFGYNDAEIVAIKEQGMALSYKGKAELTRNNKLEILQRNFALMQQRLAEMDA
ncbi:MAG: hypothetical protein MJZ34_08090 [Paludibacteraceae bacterium]|nr:hypothetical protein [Paludibacteraceae bacterium]